MKTLKEILQKKCKVSEKLFIKTEMKQLSVKVIRNYF